MSPDSGSSAISGGTFGIGIASAILSGAGQIASGKQQQAAYDYNADVTLQETGEKIVASEQRYSQLVGKQAAAYAASGVDITRGSPLLMMAATAGRGGRQAAELYESGTEEATLERYYGKIAAWRGTVAGIGSMLSGISSATQQYLKSRGTGGSSGGGGGDDSGSFGSDSFWLNS